MKGVGKSVVQSGANIIDAANMTTEIVTGHSTYKGDLGGSAKSLSSGSVSTGEYYKENVGNIATFGIYGQGKAVIDYSYGHISEGEFSERVGGTGILQAGAASIAKVAKNPNSVLNKEVNTLARTVVSKLKGKGNSSAASTLLQNKANGAAFEPRAKAYFEREYSGVEQQVTIKSNLSGTRIRVDLIGRDNNGSIGIGEAKSSATAPLTKNQKIAFPEIQENGGIVVGKGIANFPGGTETPPTKAQIIRPENVNKFD